jgi:hypothetical protein
MIIEIDDNCDKKLKTFHALMAVYALEKFGGNRNDSAKFLGIAIRTLRLWINTMPQLARFKIKNIGIVKGNEDWKRYTNGKNWVTKSTEVL